MKPCSSGPRAGFTLIELLAVIAIIALLAGLLFPALNAAREKGNAARCLSNLKQWGTAMNLYLADVQNDGMFPSAGVVDDTLVVSDTGAWFNVLAPYIGEVSLGKRAADSVPPQPRPRDSSVYTCPSATTKEMLDFEAAKGVTLDAEADPYMSYSYNLWIDHAARAGDNPGGKTGFGQYLRLSQILKPAKFVVFGEIAGNAGHCISYDLAYRHSGPSVNLCFADGHAANYSSNDICSHLSNLPGQNDNKGGIIWNPEGTLPQSDPSF